MNRLLATQKPYSLMIVLENLDVPFADLNFRTPEYTVSHSDHQAGEDLCWSTYQGLASPDSKAVSDLLLAACYIILVCDSLHRLGHTIQGHMSIDLSPTTLYH